MTDVIRRHTSILFRLQLILSGFDKHAARRCINGYIYFTWCLTNSTQKLVSLAKGILA